MMTEATKTILMQAERLIALTDEYLNCGYSNRMIDEINERLSGFCHECGVPQNIPYAEAPRIRMKKLRHDAGQLMALNTEGWYLLAIMDIVRHSKIDWSQVYG